MSITTGIHEADSPGVAEESDVASAQALAELVARVIPMLQRAMIAEMHGTPHAEGMSLTQFRVMARLNEREYRAAELADALEVGRSSMTVTTDSLVRRGLVQRVRALPGDRRAVVLRLTEAGRALYRAIESQAVGAVAELLQDTTRQERIGLSIGLAALERSSRVSGRSASHGPGRVPAVAAKGS